MLNLVVLSTEITGSSDEVNVVVGVIILFELDRLKLESGERFWCWKLLDNAIKRLIIITTSLVSVRVWLLLVGLDLHSRIGLEVRDDHVVENFNVVLLRCIRLDAVVERM